MSTYESILTAEADRSKRRGGESSRGQNPYLGGRKDSGYGSGGRSTAAKFFIPMLHFDQATGRNNFKEFKEAADISAAAEYPGAAGDLPQREVHLCRTDSYATSVFHFSGKR